MSLLTGKGVAKHFGGVVAVNQVDFAVEQGEVFGLIGPNGAGKTTLLNLISRVYSLTNGEIVLNGHKISSLPPHRIARLGIARTFQIVKPFSGMNVRENVCVGSMFGRATGRAGIGEAMHRADEILELVGLAPVAGTPVTSLTLAQRKKLELARALSMDPILLLLDEVVAGLNPVEVEEMIKIIRNINRRGTTIIMIEHVMRAVMSVCTRIMVLNWGKKIAEGSPQEIVNNDEVIKAYLGEKFAKSS